MEIKNTLAYFMEFIYYLRFAYSRPKNFTDGLRMQKSLLQCYLSR